MFKWLFGPSGGQSGKKSAKDEPTLRNLWDTEFKIIAKGGLDPDQVIAYVDEMKTRHQASQDAQEASVRSIVHTALADAHEIAEKIRTKAEKDAEAAANSFVAEAKKDAEAIKHKAEVEAQQTAAMVATAADKSARLTGAEAQDKAVLFLLRAREQIEREVIGEFSEAYTRLTAALEKLVNEGKELGDDLRGRREELLKSKVFQLTEGDVPLIGAPAESAGEDAVDVASDDAEVSGADSPVETTADAKEAADVKKASATVEAEPAAEEAAVVDAEPVTAVEDLAIVESEVEVTAATDAVAAGDEAFAELTEEETQALYIGEVDIVVPTPVDAKMISDLHSYLQTTPEIKLVRTAGSMGRGTVITIAIDKPVPLIGALSSKIPDAAIALERHRGDGSPGLPGATKKIRMVLRTD